MESPLEVLSRAATMVQDNANESRLTTKELPTAKWRRDRRLRTSEYQHSISSSSSSPPSSPLSAGHNNNSSMKPLTETTNTTSNNTNSVECPIDMSVTSTTIKPRSPPPPYREPLPGSTFATALARPSVITQAPKRDSHCMISNRENDNRSTESISMCDPVIDEHFRRSLGADYMALFAKKTLSPPQPPAPAAIKSAISPRMLATTTTSSLVGAAAVPTTTAATSITPSSPPPPQVATPTAATTMVTVTNNDSSIGTSVDDHFAKALGDTWKKLQADKELRNERGDGK